MQCSLWGKRENRVVIKGFDGQKRVGKIANSMRLCSPCNCCWPKFQGPFSPLSFYHFMFFPHTTIPSTSHLPILSFAGYIYIYNIYEYTYAILVIIGPIHHRMISHHFPPVRKTGHGRRFPYIRPNLHRLIRPHSIFRPDHLTTLGARSA